MKLYHFPPSPNSRRVWAVINHLGLSCELVALDLIKGDHLQPEFVALNPNHMIPTLVDGDVKLWESHAIMTYLCDITPGQDLLPSEPAARANVMRWLFWNAAHFNGACGVFVYERYVKNALNLGQPDPQKLAEGEERFHRFGSVLDDHLKDRTWLCGEKISLGDYGVGAMLALADVVLMPWDKYQNIKRWWALVSSQDAWQRTQEFSGERGSDARHCCACLFRRCTR